MLDRDISVAYAKWRPWRVAIHPDRGCNHQCMSHSPFTVQLLWYQISWRLRSVLRQRPSFIICTAACRVYCVGLTTYVTHCLPLDHDCFYRCYLFYLFILICYIKFIQNTYRRWRWIAQNGGTHLKIHNFVILSTYETIHADVQIIINIG